MAFSTPRDSNNVPAIFGVSSVDLKTPTAIKVNPSTGALLIDQASLSAFVLKAGDTMTGELTIAVPTHTNALNITGTSKAAPGHVDLVTITDIDGEDASLKVINQGAGGGSGSSQAAVFQNWGTDTTVHVQRMATNVQGVQSILKVQKMTPVGTGTDIGTTLLVLGTDNTLTYVNEGIGLWVENMAGASQAAYIEALNANGTGSALQIDQYGTGTNLSVIQRGDRDGGLLGNSNSAIQVYSAYDQTTTNGLVNFHAAGANTTASVLTLQQAGTGNLLTALDASGVTALSIGSKGDITLSGQAARSITVGRITGSATGSQLTVQAGGAQSGGLNADGGALILAAGLATGSGSSTLALQTASPTTQTLDAISSVTINNRGSGYLANDILTITGGGGTGATVTAATVAPSGQIATISINSKGSGYVIGDILTISGGGGNATITVTTISPLGGIRLFTATGGTGYSTGTNVSVTGGTGTGATINIISIYATGAILTVSVTTPGSGYTSTTGAATTGGTGTGATLDTSPFNKTGHSPTTKVFVNGAGSMGIGTTSPTAVLHLKAGTVTAGTAPLKLTSGSNLTVPEAGTHEYNGNHYLTNAAIRYAIGGTLFDHYTDGGNTHTDGVTFDDLYTDTLAANTFNTNGDKVSAHYSGIFAASATATREIKVLFAGTTILDTGSLTTATAESFNITVLLIRVSSTVVRCAVTIIASTTAGASAFNDTTYTEVISLTLSNTNILKIVGVSGGTGAAASDIVAKLGSVSFTPAA